MALTRSARIRGAIEKEPAATAPVKPAAKPIKRKAPAKRETQNKKQATTLSHVKKEDVPQPQSSLGNKALSLFPAEVLNMILDNVKDPKTMSKLSRVCKEFYSIMAPRLHNRVVAVALYHAHIQKLIRAIEPYLSIVAKKQLKKEGAYKGQQIEYPKDVDESAIPVCASHVRQLVVGAVDPGRKHEHICERYIEEALKSMKKLEVVDIMFLTEPIAQRLASLENLQALKLSIKSRSDKNTLLPLANIKNLKHFKVEKTSSLFRDNIVPEILMRSQSTLKTLSLHADPNHSTFLKGCQISESDGSCGYAFTSLERLELECVGFDEDFIKSLQKAFNFVSLRELRLKNLAPGKFLFIRHLTHLLQSCNRQDIRLRTLCLDMSDSKFSADDDKDTHDPCCELIASFDTLTSLELHGCHRFLDNVPDKSGMPDSLLQAILRHPALQTLKISSHSGFPNDKTLYLSAVTVASIVDGLPKLQDFEFAPEEDEIDEIGRVLSRAPNLTSVTCAPGYSYVQRILTGFLSTVTDSGTFKWEEHFKLKRVFLTGSAWEVASKFGKREKGHGQLRKTCSPHDEEKKVEFREISGTFPSAINAGHDPEHKWVESVAKEDKVTF